VFGPVGGFCVAGDWLGQPMVFGVRSAGLFGPARLFAIAKHWRGLGRVFCSARWAVWLAVCSVYRESIV